MFAIAIAAHRPCEPAVFTAPSRTANSPGAIVEGGGSPGLGVWQCPEFGFWPAASGITGGPQRQPVPSQDQPACAGSIPVDNVTRRVSDELFFLHTGVAKWLRCDLG